MTYDRNQADVDDETDGYLTHVSGQGDATFDYEYDVFGRASKSIDTDGYSVVLGYDAINGLAAKTLNRVVRRTYPDGNYEEKYYDRMEPQWIRDRLGQ